MDVGGRATQDAKAEPRRRSNLLLPKPQIAASLGLLAMTAERSSPILGRVAAGTARNDGSMFLTDSGSRASGGRCSQLPREVTRNFC